MAGPCSTLLASSLIASGPGASPICDGGIFEGWIMLVLQPRDRRLLQAVSQLKIVDKKQAQALGGFGSNARLNARLYKLTHAGFLRCHQMASDIGGKKSFYSLAPEAADGNASVSSWVSRNSAVFTAGAAGFVRRQLLANEVYIAAMKPSGRRI